MAKPIDQIGLNKLSPTIKALAKAGGTTEHADWIRSGSNAALLVQFIDEQRDLLEKNFSDKNTFEMSVENQLAALSRANDEEKWGLTEVDFFRLVETAPTWPEGKHAYRSFRIRFGEGDEGVALTFERHVARIKSVFGESDFWRREGFHSGKVQYKGKLVERLRLLNGNHTHKPVIEWVVADLDTNRKRESVTAVCEARSLADELLVIAWMFPDMIRAIDYDKLPAPFAAGYEYNVPEYDSEAWQRVVIVYFDRRDSQVSVDAYDCRLIYSGYSVPVLRE